MALPEGDLEPAVTFIPLGEFLLTLREVLLRVGLLGVGELLLGSVNLLAVGEGERCSWGFCP